MEEQNMDGMQDNAGMEQTDEKPRSGSGPLIAIIIIIIVLILGVFYFFSSSPSDELDDTAADPQTEALGAVSDSDEVEDIEDDLLNTGLDDLDNELEDIDSLLEE